MGKIELINIKSWLLLSQDLLHLHGLSVYCTQTCLKYSVHLAQIFYFILSFMSHLGVSFSSCPGDAEGTGRKGKSPQSKRNSRHSYSYHQNSDPHVLDTKII